jgi:sugar phosphate isomerase/epimerase
MKYSCSTLILPELKDRREILKRLKDFGYDGVDWRVQTDYHIVPGSVEKEARQLKAMCSDFGLDIAALSTYLSLNQLDLIKDAVNGAVMMDCKRIRLAGCNYDGSRSYQDVYNEAIDQLGDIERLFKGSKVKALLEVHFGTIHSSPSGVLNLVRHFDPATIGVIVDPSNMIIEGREDWKMGFELLSGYLSHVHVRNTSWYYSEGKGWEWKWDALNKGMVDWAKVMKALKSLIYDVYLTNENILMVQTSSKGYIGERHDSLKGYEGTRSIEERLADIVYLRSLE